LSLAGVVCTVSVMTSNSRLVSFRIETWIASQVPELAEHRGVCQSQLIEDLLREERKRANLGADPDDPGVALEELLDDVKQLLEDRRTRNAVGPDIIKDTFADMALAPPMMKRHETAVRPPSSGMTPERRRQYVHARIARFIKRHLGLESGDEVTLPRGSDALIRSYTRLG
jgi:hypothetical protein